jgi:hypothetical protein
LQRVVVPTSPQAAPLSQVQVCAMPALITMFPLARVLPPALAERLPAGHCALSRCAACRGCVETGTTTTTAPRGVRRADSRRGAAEEAADSDNQATGGVCLSVWREDPMDGSPLVFTACLRPPHSGQRNSWQRWRQQQWGVLEQPHAASATTDSVVTLHVENTPHLCATVSPIHALEG